MAPTLMVSQKKPPRSRAKQPQFERLNITSEQQVGFDATMQTLSQIADRVDRFRKASAIATDSNARQDILRERRHELAVGLSAYHGVRAVHEAAGMWRDVMRRVTLRTLGVERVPTMADRVADPDAPEATKTNVVDREAVVQLAEDAGVPRPAPVDDDGVVKQEDIATAIDELVNVGREYLRLDGERKAATKTRDDLAVDLYAEEVLTWREIIDTMGVDATHMSHLLSQARRGGREIPTPRTRA